MTNRDMIDCTHANLPSVLGHVLAPLDMVACYVTGTPDIRWTDADKAKVQGHTLVTIDQGANGSPIPTATVRDIEAGAWSVAAAVDRSNWDAERPTQYISRSRLGELVTAGWDGDVWMADWTGTASILPPMPPRGARFKIVAWQFANRGFYDLSTVYDPDWPGIPATPTIPTWQENAMQALPTIKQGATGKAVDTVQGLLKARGVTGITIDGIFGPATAAGVKTVQTWASIAVDGIVGPQTWPVLMGVA